MRRRLLTALFSVAAVLSCAKPEKDLAGLRPVMNETGTVVISQKSLSLIIGSGYTLTAEVKPWNSKDKTITYGMLKLAAFPVFLLANGAGVGFVFN